MSALQLFAKRSALVGPILGIWAELRTNRRAVLGLLAIVTIVVGYGLVWLNDAAARLRLEEGRERLRLQRVVEIARETEWPERVDASQQAREALEARLWTAPSEGVARADIQDWISGIGREVGLPNLDIRIELTKPPALPADLRQITATIAAQPLEAAVVAMLDRIERSPHLVVVDRLNLKQQPGPYLEMALIGYARIGAARDNAADVPK